MQKANFTSYSYRDSDSIELQGKWSRVKPYIARGYYVKEDRNGYYVLVKPAQLLVTLANTVSTGCFNMKQDVCNYYGRKRITKKLIGQFCEDASSGKIEFYLNEDGSRYDMR